jgi:fructokinase
MGHIALRRRAGDFAPSVCRFHENCAEGLVAGPAVLARFGKPLSAFHSTSEEVALVADYLGQLSANLVLTLSPQRIVIGGGVGAAPGLIPATRSALLAHLGSYVAHQVQMDDFLCAPVLGQDAGIIGALCNASLVMPL